MPKGWCPEYFYYNPNLEKEKTMEEIWSEIQYYSGEFFADDDMRYRIQTDFITDLSLRMSKKQCRKIGAFTAKTRTLIPLASDMTSSLLIWWR